MYKQIATVMFLTLLIFVGGYAMSYLPSDPFSRWWAMPFFISVICWVATLLYVWIAMIFYKGGKP